MSEKTYTYRKKGKFPDGSARLVIEMRYKGSVTTKNLPRASELWFVLDKMRDGTFLRNNSSDDEDVFDDEKTVNFGNPK